MAIVSSMVDNGVLLTVDGRLTMGSSTTALRAAVQQLIDAGTKGVVLELGTVSYVDSAALGALAACAAQAKAAGTTLLVANLHTRVREAICLVGLDRVLMLHPGLESALAVLKGLSAVA